jgi:hypothetical protein
MTEINCEYCEEPLNGPDKFPFFGDIGFCSLDCVSDYGYDCGRPIHREMLDWKDVPYEPEASPPIRRIEL